MLSKFTENINKNLGSRSLKNTAKFKMPAVMRPENDFISLKKGITIGFILHPIVVLILWLLAIILAFFNIDFLKFDKPSPKVNDIEFVLVDKEQTPKDKNTRYRADMNSRTGGVNDPTKPVSIPSAQPSPKPSPSSSSSPSPAPKPKSLTDRIAQSVAPKPTQNKVSPKATTTQKNVTPSPTVEQAIQKPQAAKPQPPTAKPSVKPPMNNPKVVQKPTNSPFKVPVPAGGTKAGQYATGPVSGSGSSKNGGTKGSGTYSPNPSLAPVGNGSGTKIASGSGAGKGTGTGTGNGSGYGNGSGGGNPGGGGGRPGIDAIKEPDFGPYMRELQRKIKMNWDPPKGDESKRVVLLFKIAKDGRLLSCSVLKSSGLQNADNAALNAVKLAAPFRPLPPEYKGANIDIQFTFDYNVFGAKRY